MQIKEETIRNLCNGDKATFEFIFKEYYPLLVNYASRILNDSEVAKDLTQELFCNLWDHHSNLSINISLQAYLFKSIYTSCIDYIRHKKIEKKFADKTLEDFYFEQIIQTPEAEVKLFNSNVKSLILSSLESLPERCRNIFILTKLEGKSQAEAAEILGITTKTVENQITIAFKKLRKELEYLILFFIFFKK